MKYLCCAALAATLLLSACGGGETAPPRESPEASSAASPARSSAPEDQSSPVFVSKPESEPELSYIERAAADLAATIAEPGMSEFEMAKAGFDYIIETTHFAPPLGLGLWQIRGDYSEPPPFVENRSLSVLLFQAGECEDYAAALTMLLRAMGLEAEYMPGLTYAAAGTGFVDHSWTIARIDGLWYHLDAQLEDNITRRDTIRYKYFMRGDATMSASHRWGQNLIDSNLLTPEQNEEIRRDFLGKPCPQDYPTPAPRTFTPAPVPDREAIQAAIAEESGLVPTEALPLNAIPPVFGLDGYGVPEPGEAPPPAAVPGADQ